MEAVASIVNPDKLERLGPVADLRALLRAGGQELPRARSLAARLLPAL